MVTPTEKLAQDIKGFMRDRGWGVQDLAAASNVSEARVTSRLTGLSDFRLSEIYAFADAFGVDAGGLVESAHDAEAMAA